MKGKDRTKSRADFPETHHKENIMKGGEGKKLELGEREGGMKEVKVGEGGGGLRKEMVGD